MKNHTYTFKVSLSKKCYRVIEVDSNQSLYNFAGEVVSSFNFDLDHCFGFYAQQGYAKIKEGEAYELFVDLPDLDPIVPHAKGVSSVAISEVFVVGKKMYLLFDYGDDWWFSIECQKIEATEKVDMSAQVIKKIGKDPEQYPDYE